LISWLENGAWRILLKRRYRDGNWGMIIPLHPFLQRGYEARRQNPQYDATVSDSNFFAAIRRRLYAFSRTDHLRLFAQA